MITFGRWWELERRLKEGFLTVVPKQSFYVQKNVNMNYYSEWGGGWRGRRHFREREQHAKAQRCVTALGTRKSLVWHHWNTKGVCVCGVQGVLPCVGSHRTWGCRAFHATLRAPMWSVGGYSKQKPSSKSYSPCSTDGVLMKIRVEGRSLLRKLLKKPQGKMMMVWTKAVLLGNGEEERAFET